MGFPTEKTGWRDESTGLVSGGLVTDDGCENPTCDIHGNDARVPHAVPANELDLLIVAIDKHYVVEDLGYAGDARIINVRRKLNGEYIMTATLTQTP